MAFSEKGEISPTVLHKSVGNKTKFRHRGQEDRLALKAYFRGRRESGLVCNCFRSENHRSDHLVTKNDRAVPDKI